MDAVNASVTVKPELVVLHYFWTSQEAEFPGSELGMGPGMKEDLSAILEG